MLDDNKLSNIFGKIDEGLVEEAELINIKKTNKSHKARRIISEVLALAAGLVILIAAFNRFGNTIQKPSSSPETNDSQIQLQPNNGQVGDSITDNLSGDRNDGSQTSQGLALVKGERGTLLMKVPSTWKWEKLEEQSPNSDGVYGIKLSPLAAPDKSVTISCQAFFGVCGTGLEVKELTFGDVKGQAGYYDGSKNWSYILFTNLLPEDGTNRGQIVVMNDREHSIAGSSYEAQLFKIFESIEFE